MWCLCSLTEFSAVTSSLSHVHPSRQYDTPAQQKSAAILLLLILFIAFPLLYLGIWIFVRKLVVPFLGPKTGLPEELSPVFSGDPSPDADSDPKGEAGAIVELRQIGGSAALIGA